MLLVLSSCDNSPRSAKEAENLPASKAEYSLACANPPAPFHTRADGIDHHVIVFTAELAADGRLSVNGKDNTLPELTDTLELASQFRPMPYLVLSFADATPCDKVTELRSVLASSRLCSLGNCAEGSDWEKWPIKIAPGKFVTDE